MYPRDFFDTFWRPHIRDEVFVAMSFNDSTLEPVWQQAIQPAIEKDCGLKAIRVDVSVLTGSVITSILDHVAHSRLVLAEISIMGTSSRWAGQRNGNVMYEVGLAQAVRQSTEVVVIRYDDEQINFDVAGIQVHRYPVSDFVGTRELIAKLIRNAVREIDNTKALLVQRAIDALDADTMNYIRANAGRPFHEPPLDGPGLALVILANKWVMSLSKLQTFGMLRCEPTHPSGRPAYFWTPFGEAVIDRLGIPPRSTVPSPPPGVDA